MLPSIEQDDDIVVESRTQSADAIKAVLEGDNYAVTEEAELTDKPKEGERAKPDAAATKEESPETPEAGAEALELEPGELEVLEGADKALAVHTKLTGAQRSKRTREKLRTAEAENAELKRQLAQRDDVLPKKAVEESPGAGAPAPAKKADEAAAPKGRPDPDNFAEGRFDPAYDDAMFEWREEQREIRIAAATETKRKTDEDALQATANTQAQESWTAKVEAAKEVHADYDQVMAAAAELPISFAVHAVTKDSEKPAEVLYWLATNPEEAKRIFEATLVDAKDSPRVAARKQALAVEEVEKIEKLIEEQPGARVPGGTGTKSVPRKPIPVEPLAGRVGGNRKKLSEMSPDELRDMDTPEYVKRYREEYGRPPY